MANPMHTPIPNLRLTGAPEPSARAKAASGSSGPWVMAERWSRNQVDWSISGIRSPIYDPAASAARLSICHTRAIAYSSLSQY